MSKRGNFFCAGRNLLSRQANFFEDWMARLRVSAMRVWVAIALSPCSVRAVWGVAPFAFARLAYPEVGRAKLHRTGPLWLFSGEPVRSWLRSTALVCG